MKNASLLLLQEANLDAVLKTPGTCQEKITENLQCCSYNQGHQSDHPYLVHFQVV